MRCHSLRPRLVGSKSPSTSSLRVVGRQKGSSPEIDAPRVARISVARISKEQRAGRA